MKSKEEIEQLSKEDNRKGIERSCFIKGYNQCQQDMAKELKQDIIFPKCK